ncbi:MAG: hypothetical protein ACM3NQ_14785, partial [Bacteroidales bacterium]
GYGAPVSTIVVLLAFACRWLRVRWPMVLVLAGLACLAVADAWTQVALPRWVAGLYRLAPFLLFALLPPPSPGQRLGWVRATAICALVSYVPLAFLGTDTIGGKSLGPRLLLPLLPLLTVAAWQAIVEYLRAPVLLDRWTGRLGLVMAGCALAMHLGATIPAYAYRSAGDGATMEWLRHSPAAIVVADDYATAQLLLPLYFQKTIFLADSQPLVDKLADALGRQQFNYLVLVSRRPSQDRFALPGYRQLSSTEVGRARIEEWRR